MKMKKVLATLLAVTMIACVFAIGVSAAEHETYYDTDESDIECFNGLDFRAGANTWATYDEDEGKWVSSGWKAVILTDGDGAEHFALYNDDDDIYKIYDPATETYTEYTGDDAWDNLDLATEKQAGAYISKVANTNPNFLDKRLDWELSEDGEFITLTSLVENKNAGIFFEIDDTKTNYQVGEESKGYPEYVSIRIRNRSSATKLSFGFITSNTNSGDRFMTRSVSDLEIEANSDEWKVYTFSMVVLNGDMKHEDNKGGFAWTTKLRTFGIFPFGYDAEDGEGAYKGADMDIDYIVIGSEAYCQNYKSEIQALEESVTNIELVTAPTKMIYHVGEPLDLDGLQIKATYSDGSEAIITDCSAVYDLTTASDSATVTLKYGTNTVPLTYNVQVIGIESVEIETAPEKTTYKVSEIADGLTASLVSGTTIKVTYTDGVVKDGITPSFKNFSLSSKEPGDQIVTINYYGSTASYAAKVTTVASLKIDDIEKAIYYGDEITAADLSITCVYSDGEEVALADSGF
ncbi:MAG: bacterial Ig-like domain-containing protein, partial [Clostridia bacterium]|nr:bacterial Ig-like domain-containing protein [Clostridia bacterium]